MPINISYMGSKRNLADFVSEVIGKLPEGPLLDLFAGMCAVGEAVAPHRRIWTNDIQKFPSLVGKALFCSQSSPSSISTLVDIINPAFYENLGELTERFSDIVELEDRYLTSGLFQDIHAGNSELPYVGNDRTLELERQALAGTPQRFPYRLFTITYVGSYFGVRQCMEIDSLRYAIDHAFCNGDISEEYRDWLLIALGEVASKVNNSTGQFAQFLKPTQDNQHRVLQKRRRSVSKEFDSSVRSLRPVGTGTWRTNNHSYNCDALLLLNDLKASDKRPAVIYADPPYSKAQYSRYYHVLEVLIDYHYPPISGNGRYSNQRFRSPFSHRSKVNSSMTDLIKKISSLGSSIVLSYPTNGIFCEQGGDIEALLNSYFRRVDIKYREYRQHSTFGNSNQPASISVEENIFVGRN